VLFLPLLAWSADVNSAVVAVIPGLFLHPLPLKVFTNNWLVFKTSEMKGSCRNLDRETGSLGVAMVMAMGWAPVYGPPQTVHLL